MAMHGPWRDHDESNRFNRFHQYGWTSAPTSAVNVMGGYRRSVSRNTHRVKLSCFVNLEPHFLAARNLFDFLRNWRRTSGCCDRM